MNVDRRNFLRTAGGFALVSALEGVPALASFEKLTVGAEKKARIAVFFEAGFPEVQGLGVGEPLLKESLAGMDVVFMTSEDLAQGLDTEKFQLFLNPFGSAFPERSWESIYNFLRSGGHWVNLGGIPFSIPVVKESNSWKQMDASTEYHKKLGITSGFIVPADGVFTYRGDAETDGAEELTSEIHAEEFYELYFCFTATKDYPEEDGTGGQRDATMRALVTGKKGNQALPHVAPILQVDRLQGECTGGRWMLANFKGTLRARALRTLVEMGVRGPHSFTVRPSFACYRGAEMPSFTVQLVRPQGDAGRVISGNARLEVRDRGGRRIASISLGLAGTGSLALGRAELRGRGPLPPGLYSVSGELRLRSGTTEYRVVHTTGFWMEDRKLLSGGAPFTADSRYILRDGKPYPVTGTTYMASDVHRKFLLEPNPIVWDRDFSQMKEAGVTMVRTGVWTGWKNYMLDVGAPNEGALRAMDAFLLTARKHEIPVIFTFFAFLPEAWGGINSYLDPRAVGAQEQFVSVFAERYRDVKDILWDLINEPSFCSPSHLWSCRPNYDQYELAAWKKWRSEKLLDPSVDLPPLEEFADQNIVADKDPARVLEYRLFAQEMFEGWVHRMTGALRAAGNPTQLVTVGQDEGGTADRPNPQFFSGAVDFTSVHNWWFNDDLLWDSVITKAPARANLVEETGIMYYETAHGRPWRSETDAARLLGRKMAIAMGSGGAGFLQWIWNTNPYMKSDNEAAIGFLRADGTAKPELDTFRRVAKFFSGARELLRGARAEEVMMVIPHSQMFSARNYATEATKRCVRSMWYECRTPMSAISEYRFHDFTNPSRKLVVVPSPRLLTSQAWSLLDGLLANGSMVLLTGLFDLNERWATVPERLKRMGLETSAKPVAQEEFLRIGDSEYRLSYRGEKMQRIEKAVLPSGGTPSIQAVTVGNGTFLWSPLPVEVSDTPEAADALYKMALEKAGVRPIFTLDKPAPGILVLPAVFESAVLYTIVSECDRETSVSLVHAENGGRLEVTLEPGGIAMCFLSRKDGKIISRME